MIDQHTDNINVFSNEKTIIDRYMFALNDISGKKILDIGCGNGHGCALLSAYGAKRVIGYDINKDAIDKARERYKDNKAIEFIKDLGVIGIIPEDAFDIITSFEVFEHIEMSELDSLITRLKDLMREDGLFIFSTPINRRPTTDPFHINEMDEETMLKFLERNFSDYEIFSTIEHIDGMWTNTKIIRGVSELSRCFLIKARK